MTEQNGVGRSSATDELRRMLDERGVEWMPVAWNPQRETFYHAANGVGFCADEYTDGVRIYTDATITPEQAIAATLGPREQPPYDELIEALRRDWDIEASWDGLRRFWYVGLTDEGVRKRDEREATLGRGTCHVKTAKKIGDSFGFSLSCGHSMVNPFNDHPDYCPWCGAKVVDE